MSGGERGQPPAKGATPVADRRLLVTPPDAALPDGRTLVTPPGAALPDGRAFGAAPDADAASAPPDEDERTIPALPPMRAILTVQGGGKAGRGRAFDRFPIRLGRAADNDLVVGADAPAAVAPYHAELRLEGAVVHVRDLSSPGGTFLNDRRLEAWGAALVSSGDLVRLGPGGPSIKLLLLGREPTLGVVPEGPIHAGGSSPTLVAAQSNLPLVIVEHLAGPQAGTRRAFTTGRARIGRAEECEILVLDPDAVVSRLHAELTLEDDVLWLTDLGSANGSYLNGTRATRVRVASGDVVQLGQSGPALKVSLPPAGTAPPPAMEPRPTIGPAGPLPPTLPGDTPAARPYAAAVLAQLERDVADLAELFRGLAVHLVAANPLAARAAALDGLGPGPLPPPLLWQALAAADVTYVLPELVAHELRVEGAARGFLAVPAGVLDRLVPDWRRRLPGVPDLAVRASAVALRLLGALRTGRDEVAAAQLCHARLRAALGPGAPTPAPQAGLELTRALRAALGRGSDAMLAAARPVIDAAAAELATGGVALAAALASPAAAGLDAAALHAALRADYRCADAAQARELAAVLAGLHGRLTDASERNLRALAGL